MVVKFIQILRLKALDYSTLTLVEDNNNVDDLVKILLMLHAHGIL